MRIVRSLAFVLAALVFLPQFCQADQSAGPQRVIMTDPANGSHDIDPSLTRIAATFSRPMLDKNWSWSYEHKNLFPQVTGEPFYTNAGMTCVLPVKPEPDKRYIVWVNTAKFKTFKDKNGIAAIPFGMEFTTRRQ